jgi:hypothetical protein
MLEVKVEVKNNEENPINFVIDLTEFDNIDDFEDNLKSKYAEEQKVEEDSDEYERWFIDLFWKRK